MMASAARAVGPDARRWRRAIFASLLAGAARRQVTLGMLQPADFGTALTRALDEAGDDAANDALPAPERIEAIELTATRPWDEVQATLARTLGAAASIEVRAAAARGLVAAGGTKAADLLLGEWSRHTPAVRRAALQVLLGRPELTDRVLGAVERGSLARTELDPAQWSLLRGHKDESFRRRAAALDAAPAARQEVLARYQKSLGFAGDLERGRAVFARRCATCHRVAGAGVDVGPDIADTREKSPGALLQDILDPNRAIDGRYLAYTLATRDGRVLTGILTAESASSVTLTVPEGSVETVLAGEVQSIDSSGLSLMPEGLEKDLTLEDVADLIRFLKGWRYDQEARG